MNKNYLFTWTLLVSILLAGCSANQSQDLTGRTREFSSDWKFVRDSLVGAEQPAYDDSDWMPVDLPHDYSIMDLPGEDGPDQVGPFSRISPGNGHSTGHVLGGTGWYRKSFTLDKADAGKRVVLNFDGVYMEAEVWVNGEKAGIHTNGYTPFCFDITSLLHTDGEPNVVAVKVDNVGRNSRWYSGSGIYRNVYLTLTPRVYVADWGAFISTADIQPDRALVDVELNVQSKLEEDVEASLTIHLKDKEGRLAGTAEDHIVIPARAGTIVQQRVEVKNPYLWSVESPDLYQAEIVLETDDNIRDEYQQSFGIRSLEFSAEKGFLLNGKPVLLKGGCMHHDNGLLGAAAFTRAEERRVELMKAGGYNAIRTAHNPPSEAFLNACDRLGMLVIDEFTDMWEAYKNPQDYARYFKDWWKKDLTDMMLRDRNHPSIILWSTGNEVIEFSDTSGIRIGRELAAQVKALDPSRPVTAAVSEFFTRGGWDNTAPAFEIIDVGGYQYNWKKYVPDHQKYPERIMYASESYPLDAYESWKAVEENPYVIGDFVWTSMDYLGEVFIGGTSYAPEGQARTMEMPEGFQLPPGVNVFDLMVMMPSSWPDYVSGCGDLDITGEKKPQSLYRDVLWDNSIIEINVHEPIPEGLVENTNMWGWPGEWPSWDWTGNEGKPFQVIVYTKAPRVRLELNGSIVGEKDLAPEDKYMAVFEVPYQPGELKATAFENGGELASRALNTPGKAASISLVADRPEVKADRNDLVFVKIELRDEQGRLVSNDPRSIKLTLAGNGELAASGNADPEDMESVNRKEIRTYKGKAQAVIRPFAARGEIVLKAASEGLSPGELILPVVD